MKQLDINSVRTLEDLIVETIYAVSSNMIARYWYYFCVIM